MLNKYPCIALAFFMMILNGANTAAAETPMVIPASVQNQIVNLAAGPDGAAACTITSLLPSYYGPVPGVSGKLAVGLLDRDSENCGGMAPPQTSVVAYMISGSDYRRIVLPAGLAALSIEKILAVKPQASGFGITVLVHGPHDPLCCATQKASFAVRLTE